MKHKYFEVLQFQKNVFLDDYCKTDQKTEGLNQTGLFSDFCKCFCINNIGYFLYFHAICYKNKQCCKTET